MRVFYGFEEVPPISNAVVTVGSFDGLHMGHMSLLEVARDRAMQIGGESVVVTFDPHPRVALGLAQGLRLLTSLEERSILLEQMGVDNIIVIPFDRAFSRIEYDSFVKDYLVSKLGLSSLVVGYNHHLGRNNEGSGSELVRLGEECGFEVCRVDAWRNDQYENVSSTVVRRLISEGDVEGARALLSRDYLLVGRGDEDGRVWFSESLKLVPASGRYLAKVNGEESEIAVDSNGVVSSPIKKDRVVIEVIKRL